MRPPRSLLISSRRGQTLLEAAAVVPVLLLAFTACFQIWTDFQRTAVYSRTALTVAELISKNGAYTSAMGDTIKELMDEAIGIDTTKAYLHVVVLPLAEGSAETIGDPVVLTPVLVDGAPEAPTDTGWTGSLSAIANGQTIEVDVWGYNEVGFIAGGWTTTLGRATAIAAPIEQ